MITKSDKLIIRDLGLQDYEPVWKQMQAFTAQRDDSTPDELWCLQHPPVFTMGLNGKPQHLLNVSDIPVIDIDRGGQVTYHGPGQLVIYTLIDLGRMHIGVKELVAIMEQAIITLLKDYGIEAQPRENAPGVYVGEAKIAALGLRIKKNHSYHGLSLNIDMDLSPFSQINPCGYEGMPVTQVSDLRKNTRFTDIKTQLELLLSGLFGYNAKQIIYKNQLPESQ